MRGFLKNPVFHATLWTAFVVFLLSVPGRYIPSQTVWSYDKVGHVFLFWGLAFFWLRAFSAHSARLIIVILISGLVFAPLSELYQGIISTGRTVDFMDSLADGIGFILGTLAWTLIDRIKRRESRPTDDLAGA